MPTNTDLRVTLNHLIQTCRDGQEGYRTAAENIEDVELRKFLNESSLQRAKFAGELQSAAHTLGDSNPESASSVLGTLHRGWINLTHAIHGRDPQAILAECERGEVAALEQYHKTLTEPLPADLQQTLRTQQTAIQQTHAHLKTLQHPSPRA